MAGISIDFAANVGKFIGGTNDVTSALEGVSDSLDDMARDAQQAGEKAERGLKEIEAKDARDQLRRLAAEARETGSDMEQYFSAAADEIDAELKAMSTKAEDRLEEIGDAAKDAGKDVDKGLTDGAKDAETAAETLERSFKDTFDTVKGDAKKAGDDVSTETKRGFKDAEDATGTFRDEARANLSESVSSFRGDVEDLPQLLQDVLGGVSADLGLLGGLIAAGGAAAIGIAIAQLQGVADRVNEAKEKVGELTTAISDADGDLSQIDLGERFRTWANEIQDARSWFEIFQKDAVTNFENVAKAADTTGESLGMFVGAITDWDSDEANRVLESYRAGLERVTDEHEAAAKSTERNSVEGKLLTADLEDQKTAYGVLIEQLQKQIKEKEAAYDASVAQRAAEERVTEETIRQRDAIAEQNSAIEENNGLKNEAIDTAGKAFLAEGEYSTSVQDATRAIADNNAKIAENGAGHADNAKLVQDNREQIVGIAGDSRTYAQNMADAGRTQGEVNGILQRGRQDFLNAASAAGMGADEANRLADELGLIPDSVEVTVSAKVNGMSAVDSLNRTLNNLDGRTVTSYVAMKQGYNGLANSGTVVPESARPRRAASGEFVQGEGSDIEDRVPYMLSPGEAVLDKQAVDQQGGPGIIDILNNGQQLGDRRTSSYDAIDYGRLGKAVADAIGNMRFAPGEIEALAGAVQDSVNARFRREARLRR